ncbi:MAG: hypothetical protein WD826_00145 [Actinomycetota bacterium]
MVASELAHDLDDPAVVAERHDGDLSLRRTVDEGDRLDDGNDRRYAVDSFDLRDDRLTEAAAVEGAGPENDRA